MDFNHEQSSPQRSIWLQTRSDEDLMALVRKKDPDAMALLFDRYHRLVQTVAWRILRDSDEAEDLVQSVFLEVFQLASRFDPAKGTAKVWILQYAYHRGFSRREYLKRRSVYNRASQFAQERAAASERNSVLTLESKQFVREAFACLSVAERKIIELAFYEGLTMYEVAKTTGSSFDSVRHHFYRGMRKLRSILREGEAGR